MAISFNPPDWVIREYINRKSPWQEASEGLQTGIANYMAIDEAKRRNALIESQNAAQKATQEREGRQMFYNYGDPTYLPQDIQSGLNNPLQGPSNAVDVPLPQGVQGPVNQMQVPPSESPIISHFRQFKEQFPQGLMAEKLGGMVTDTIAQKDTAGNIIGYTQVQRPRGGRTLLAGPSQMGTPQLAEIPGTGQMAWFTPPQPSPTGAPQPVSTGTTPSPSPASPAPQGTPPPIPARPGATVTPVAQGMSLGEKNVDDEFAKEYTKFISQGGLTDSTKLLAGLGSAINKMKQTDAASGPFIGQLPRGARATVSPTSGRIEDEVRDVVQRNLRVILGGQFAEKEGENLVANALNPRLPESENVPKLERLYKQLDAALKDKQAAVQYFKQHGTLRGYQGKIWSINDFYVGDESQALGGGLTPEKKSRLEELRAKRAAGTLR